VPTVIGTAAIGTVPTVIGTVGIIGAAIIGIMGITITVMM
jgi:hypothetical protein